jgi:hypothetical protein
MRKVGISVCIFYTACSLSWLLFRNTVGLARSNEQMWGIVLAFSPIISVAVFLPFLRCVSLDSEKKLLSFACIWVLISAPVIYNMPDSSGTLLSFDLREPVAVLSSFLLFLISSILVFIVRKK